MRREIRPLTLLVCMLVVWAALVGSPTTHALLSDTETAAGVISAGEDIDRVTTVQDRSGNPSKSPANGSVADGATDRPREASRAGTDDAQQNQPAGNDTTDEADAPTTVAGANASTADRHTTTDDNDTASRTTTTSQTVPDNGTAAATTAISTARG